MVRNNGTLLMAVIWALGLAQGAWGQPSLSLGAVTGAQGDDVTLVLQLGGGTEAYAGVNARFTLPAGVQVTSVSKGDLTLGDFVADFHQASNSSSAAVLAYSGTSTFGNTSGSLLLVNLYIDSNAAVGGPYPVSFETSGLSNEDGSTSVAHGTVNGSITITASVPETADLTMAVQGQGTTTPGFGTHTYNLNQSVQVSATPANGWVFTRWEGDLSGSTNPTDVVMSGNKSVTAVFTESPGSVTLTMAVQGQGTTSPAVGPHSYTVNHVVPVQATPAQGWRFDRWENGLTGSTNPSSVTMNTSKTVTAVFVQDSSAPSPPQSVQASDGTFSDRVQITWNAVAGASGYRVYKSPDGNIANASVLGETGNTVANDYGAAPPIPATTATGGCGGGTQGAPTPVTYTYWVKALANGSESDFSTGDTGYRGASNKNWIDGLHETTLPPLPGPGEYHMAGLTDTLAVRLRADEPIDPGSLRGTVEGAEVDDVELNWVEVRGANGTDGWVYATPEPAWPADATISLHVEGSTTSGTPLEPQSRSFISTDAPLDDTVVDPLAEAIGTPFSLRAAGSPAMSTSVVVPIPEGYAMDSIALYYFVSDGPDRGWHPAEYVQGLVAGVLPIPVTIEGRHYISAELNHGGIFQWGIRQEQAPSASGVAPSSTAGKAGFLYVAFLLGILLVLYTKYRRGHEVND